MERPLESHVWSPFTGVGIELQFGHWQNYGKFKVSLRDHWLAARVKTVKIWTFRCSKITFAWSLVLPALLNHLWKCVVFIRWHSSSPTFVNNIYKIMLSKSVMRRPKHFELLGSLFILFPHWLHSSSSSYFL